MGVDTKPRAGVLEPRVEDLIVGFAQRTEDTVER